MPETRTRTTTAQKVFMHWARFLARLRFGSLTVKGIHTDDVALRAWHPDPYIEERSWWHPFPFGIQVSIGDFDYFLYTDKQKTNIIYVQDVSEAEPVPALDCDFDRREAETLQPDVQEWIHELGFDQDVYESLLQFMAAFVAFARPLPVPFPEEKAIPKRRKSDTKEAEKAMTVPLDHYADLVDVFNCLSIGLAQVRYASLVVRDYDRGEVTIAQQPLRSAAESRRGPGGLCLTWCGREFDVTSERWTKRNQLTVTEIRVGQVTGVGEWVCETKFSSDIGACTKAFVYEFLAWVSEQVPVVDSAHAR